MARKLLLSGITLVLLSVGTLSQNEATTDSTDDDDPTTVAPQSLLQNVSELEPSGYICGVCVCKDGKVDCHDQSLEKFFTQSEWSGLKDHKPSTVDLSHNLIEIITPMVELPIEILNLSRNSIETIERGSFRDLTQLRVLDLSYNRLTSEKLRPHIFEGRYAAEKYGPLGAMKTLILAYNDLHSLHYNLFEHLPDLVELDISGNPLVYLDHVTVIAISSLPYLKVLRLRSCQISEIPRRFLHTPKYLEKLDISDNKFTAVPQELEETKNLLYLNMNQNPIIRLEKNDKDHPGFPDLEKLEELHMCFMPDLQTIGDGAMGGLQNLKRLHMSYNFRLHFIHPKALAKLDFYGEHYNWPMVKELNLRFNNLTRIDSRLLLRWDLVESMDLSHNPYVCDCSTHWMIDVLVTIIEAKKPNASNHLICLEPIEVLGSTMKHLHETHRHKFMRCEDKYSNRPEWDGALLLGARIGVLLALSLMLIIALLWRCGYFGWLGTGGPNNVTEALYRPASVEDPNLVAKQCLPPSQENGSAVPTLPEATQGTLPPPVSPLF